MILASISSVALALAPNSSTRTDINANQIEVSADALYWFASEETSNTWASVIGFPAFGEAIFQPKSFAFHWDFGFRFGLGYDFIYDQWDTQAYWTWYQTDVHSQIPLRPNFAASPEFFAAFINDLLEQGGSLSWSLHYNMFDWELGRSFWISSGLAVRPFIGIKGGWINQSIHSKWISFHAYNAHENLSHDFWGVGPVLGTNCQWNFANSSTQFFNLFGDFSAATLWGHWSFKDRYTNPTPKRTPVLRHDSTLGSLTLRGFMGLGWDTDFNDGKSHFAVKLGYEMQYWANQLRLSTFQQLPLHGNLTLQGGTFNCRFDF